MAKKPSQRARRRKGAPLLLPEGRSTRAMRGVVVDSDGRVLITPEPPSKALTIASRAVEETPAPQATRTRTRTKKARSFFETMKLRAKGVKRAGVGGTLRAVKGGAKGLVGARGLSLLKGAAVPLGLNLLAVGAEYAPEIARAAKRDFGSNEDPMDRMMRYDSEIRSADRLRELQRKKLKRLTEANIVRLQTSLPHLAASIAAGQEIPEDGVVIGGTPRQDLLEQVARQMAGGAFDGEEGV